MMQKMLDNYGSKKSNYVIGVDPGKEKGGIVSGSSLEDCYFIEYPTWNKGQDWKDLQKHWKPSTAIYLETSNATNAFSKSPNLGAKRNYNLGFQQGAWTVVSSAFTKLNTLYPITWRRIVFSTVPKKDLPSGENSSMGWKILEMKLAKLLCPRLFEEFKFYKSDHAVYGKSAAFGVWLAGCQNEGLIDIAEEIRKAKHRINQLFPD